jgi:hypothetical protein
MNELVKYTAEGLENFQVRIEADTVWLTQAQMVELFERDQSVISRHINNVFKEKELEKESNMHFLHIANADKPAAFYSLDVIISVGYRVKSQRGTQFRIWATKILREYLLKGVAIHRPASKAELANVEERLKKQLEEIRQQLENSEIVADVQFGEIYQALIELTSQKKLTEEKPRKKIGFKVNSE